MDDEEDNKCKFCRMTRQSECDGHPDLVRWLTYGSARNFRVAAEALLELLPDEAVTN